jgi:hypothetical protein
MQPMAYNLVAVAMHRRLAAKNKTCVATTTSSVFSLNYIQMFTAAIDQMNEHT